MQRHPKDKTLIMDDMRGEAVLLPGLSIPSGDMERQGKEIGKSDHDRTGWGNRLSRNQRR